MIRFNSQFCSAEFLVIPVCIRGRLKPKLSYQAPASFFPPLSSCQRHTTLELSRTVTITGAPPNKVDGSFNGTSKRRGSSCKPLFWRDDVVDNEGAGKKSPKSSLFLLYFGEHVSFCLVCCIYHKSKAFGEPSDEDSDDSGSDSCDHNHISHRHAHRHSSGGHREGLESSDSGFFVQHIEHVDPSSNAYEIARNIKQHNRASKSSVLIQITLKRRVLGLADLYMYHLVYTLE